MSQNLQNESGNKNIPDLSFQRKLESSSLVTNHKSLVTRHYACGRSMLEMLGVLAVIGVLSIGALGAYTAAMNKHRANRILNDVALAFAEIQTKEEVPEGLLDVGFTPDSGLTINAFRNNDGYDFVQIEGVLSNVCENLLQYKNSGNIGLIYSADGTTELTTCGNNQTMIFGLSDTANSTGTVTPPVTDPCEGIVCNGACQTACLNGSCGIVQDGISCGTNKICSSGICTCDEGYYGDDCQLIQCALGSNTWTCSFTQTCDSAVNKCCDNDSCSCSDDSFLDNSENCISCNEEGNYFLTTKENCHHCSNRIFSDTHSQCYSCNSVNGVASRNAEECRRCGMLFVDGDNPACRQCNDKGVLLASESECAACSNRVLTTEGCALGCLQDSDCGSFVCNTTTHSCEYPMCQTHTGTAELTANNNYYHYYFKLNNAGSVKMDISKNVVSNLGCDFYIVKNNWEDYEVTSGTSSSASKTFSFSAGQNKISITYTDTCPIKNHTVSFTVTCSN